MPDLFGTGHYLVVADVRERLLASKQANNLKVQYGEILSVDAK
jgi:hypothetical protein